MRMFTTLFLVFSSAFTYAKQIIDIDTKFHFIDEDVDYRVQRRLKDLEGGIGEIYVVNSYKSFSQPLVLKVIKDQKTAQEVITGNILVKELCEKTECPQAILPLLKIGKMRVGPYTDDSQLGRTYDAILMPYIRKKSYDPSPLQSDKEIVSTAKVTTLLNRVIKWINTAYDVSIFLNKWGLAHNDIKTENVFEDDRTIYISDFDCVRPINQPAGCFTEDYVSPEAAFRANCKSDLFSIAAMGFNIIFGLDSLKMIKLSGYDPEIIAEYFQDTRKRIKKDANTNKRKILKTLNEIERQIRNGLILDAGDRFIQRIDTRDYILKRQE